MQKIALPFVACLLAFAAAAQAQTLWKWRDASGQIHISDKAPPAGTPAKSIISSPPGGVPVPPQLTTETTSTTSTTTTTAATPAVSGAADTALDKKKKAADNERVAKEKADRAAIDAKNAAIRKDNCARAQAALNTINSGQRMARTLPNGDREMLDDAGRAAEARRTQDVISQNCGPAPAGQ